MFIARKPFFAIRLLLAFCRAVRGFDLCPATHIYLRAQAALHEK
jgi:hypothetical protein